MINKNYSFLKLFVFCFLVFFIKNNLSMELGSVIFYKVTGKFRGMFSHRLKDERPILSDPLMQLSFKPYNNLLSLYLVKHLFGLNAIKNNSIFKDAQKRKNLTNFLLIVGYRFGLEGLDRILENNFEEYFKGNLKKKKYINFSTNILWYFFSTYAFLLKSDRFKKMINSKEYLVLFDKKIKTFVPYFNLIYPFIVFIEDKYFEKQRWNIKRWRIDTALV